MKITDTEILFTSLVGSKIAQSIPRLSLVENELAKTVLPAIPFFPIKSNPPEISNSEFDEQNDIAWRADSPIGKEQQFFPLSFSVDNRNTWYLLPYEPFISVYGKNTIIRRNVAKIKNSIGSVKERWSQADYEITITGVLIGDFLKGDVSRCFPRTDFERLRRILTTAKQIDVQCPLLELLGINQIVIEDFSFPFSKGENVQAYEIKAYSDFPYQLLIDRND